MSQKYLPQLNFILPILFLVFWSFIVNATPLSIKQAETVALTQSPEIKSLRAKSRELEQKSIAAGQLVDPKLMLGTLNIPVDSFDFSQEPMTQVQVGLQQSFPRGRSLHYHSLQTKELSRAESNKQEVMRLYVLQSVRLVWLDLYYWLRAKRLVIEQKKVFQHLVSITESMLANNKAQQRDVIRAQLELSELDNRLLEINQKIDTARVELERWIGAELASKAQPGKLPGWPSLPRIEQFYEVIKQHYILKKDGTLISAGHEGINLAKQQYKPGFAVGVAYGIRQGHNINGKNRPDFLTAQVSMDLPLFPGKRQDRNLQASQENLIALEENQESDYRQLKETLKTQYAIWQQQQKSHFLYQRHLVPEAKQYAEATVTAYQNNQTDFPTLARAYVRELDIQLAGLRAVVDRDIARINLLYLQGQ